MSKTGGINRESDGRGAVVPDWSRPLAADVDSQSPISDLIGHQGIISNRPDSISWLKAAARLPAKTFHVAVALWFLRAWASSRSTSLTNLETQKFGVDRNAKYRGLAYLEKAKLVSVVRRVGRAPTVTILDEEGQ